MTEELINKLREITPEEQKILEGHRSIEKELYMDAESDVVDAGKLLDEGKLIQVRAHTRFAHFPAHRHNYVEMIYMCRGQTHHVINGEDVYLHQGELLLLSQNAVQEIYPAGKEDIAVNFIILPEFFEDCLKMIASEENTLRDFVIHCLRGENDSSGYLHFKVAEVLPIQNLIENLIFPFSCCQKLDHHISGSSCLDWSCHNGFVGFQCGQFIQIFCIRPTAYHMNLLIKAPGLLLKFVYGSGITPCKTLINHSCHLSDSLRDLLFCFTARLLNFFCHAFRCKEPFIIAIHDRSDPASGCFPADFLITHFRCKFFFNGLDHP